MTGQAGSEKKAQSTVLSNFQGKTTHLLEFSIAIILIKVKGAIPPPPDADSSTSGEDAEANTNPHQFR